MTRTTKIVLGIVLLVVLGFMGLVGGAIYLVANREKSPARQKFDDANRYIILKKTGSPAQYGNSAMSQGLAYAYSKMLSEKCSKAFTGGRKEGGPTFTGGEFLVYCQQTEGATAFIVHVPDFDLYQGDALDALADLSWETAQALVKHDPKIKLGIGLRGAVFYGPVWIGTGEGIAEEEGSGVRGLQKLYPFFDPALKSLPIPAPVAQPAPPVLTPVAPVYPPKNIPNNSTKPIPPPKNF